MASIQIRSRKTSLQATASLRSWQTRIRRITLRIRRRRKILVKCKKSINTPQQLVSRSCLCSAKAVPLSRQKVGKQLVVYIHCFVSFPVVLCKRSPENKNESFAAFACLIKDKALISTASPTAAMTMYLVSHLQPAWLGTRTPKKGTQYDSMIDYTNPTTCLIARHVSNRFSNTRSILRFSKKNGGG